jgi:AraC family transcriptional regulator
MQLMPDMSSISSQAQPVRYLDLLSRAVAHIGEHLADPLDTEVLARQASMSPYHFHRLFRAYFGTTVAGYVTWRRLQRACDLLGRDDASVLDVALAVGYESAQALAKAMRRELDTTPTAVRAGTAPNWHQLFERRGTAGVLSNPPNDPQGLALKPQLIDTPDLWVLTATGRGMHNGDMTRAAEAGFAELLPATGRAGLSDRVKSCIAIFPDEPRHPNDEQARMWVGAIFDYALVDRSGSPARPHIDLHGSLAWRQLPAGRHAVFTHIGPYTELHRAWSAAYGQWLPATGYALRDTPPFEHYVNDPRQLPPQQWRTDIHLPLQ